MRQVLSDNSQAPSSTIVCVLPHTKVCHRLEDGQRTDLEQLLLRVEHSVDTVPPFNGTHSSHTATGPTWVTSVSWN
jgi:hypothetical protein